MRHACMQVVGAPLAATLLSLDGLLGLRGYQWLFIVEGMPTIALGIYIRHSLHEGPASASFLTPEEREWCLARAKGVRSPVFACTPNTCLCHRSTPTSLTYPKALRRARRSMLRIPAANVASGAQSFSGRRIMLRSSPAWRA